MPSSWRAPAPLLAVGLGELGLESLVVSLTGADGSGSGDLVVEEPGGGAIGQLHHHADALAVGHFEVLHGAGGIGLEGGHKVSGDAVAHPGDPHLRADGDGSLGHVRRDAKVAPG